ncbi:recombinase family protein [Microbacterium invictum]|uniref:Recombinase family protein n=1 Tax=Microbacterium invictum TaxID=515415 RepID=A0ABZ0VHJ4_9MICO|nr:recombinase family protein [Microbacterium invictum]WQB71975.1 recombinase family protein [Microbacterium invictum]
MTDCDIYCRVSIDKDGRSLAVERQEEECRELARSLELTVRKVWVDNDISATTGKTRKDFEAMLKAKPKAIVVWHQDRLVRKGTDLERVIALNVNIHSVSGGILDLATPQGRMMARTVAAFSQYEGEQKALRQLSKNRQLAATGMPVPGRRRFGFEPGNITARPEEARAVQNLFRDFLDGSSIRSLAKNLGWRTLRVRETLANPGYAGWVVWNGERFEAHESVARIVDRDLFEGVQAILSAPGRRTSPGATIRHLASGIAICGVCDGRLSYRNSYLCLQDLSHPTIKKAYLDDTIRKAIVEALFFAPSVQTHESHTVTTIDRRMAELELEKAELVKAVRSVGYKAVQHELDAVAKESESLALQRAEVLSQSVQESVLADLRQRIIDAQHRASIQAAVDLKKALAQRFDELPLDHQRELVRGHLIIKVHPGRGTDRIDIKHLVAVALNEEAAA